MKNDENMKVFENLEVKTLRLEDICCCFDEKYSKNNQKFKMLNFFLQNA